MADLKNAPSAPAVGNDDFTVVIDEGVDLDLDRIARLSIGGDIAVHRRIDIGAGKLQRKRQTL